MKQGLDALSKVGKTKKRVWQPSAYMHIWLWMVSDFLPAEERSDLNDTIADFPFAADESMNALDCTWDGQKRHQAYSEEARPRGTPQGKRCRCPGIVRGGTPPWQRGKT